MILAAGAAVAAREDPTLVIPSAFEASWRRGEVTGTVSGGAGYPQPANHRSALLFQSPETVWSSYLDITTGAYDMFPLWLGPATTAGTIRVLQWQIDPSTYLPIEYKGYGARTDVVVSDGGSVTGQDVQLGSVVSGSVSGTVTVPTGYTLLSKTVLAAFGTSVAPAEVELLNDGTNAGSFTYSTPSVPRASLTVRAEASAGGAFAMATRAGIGPNASGISLAIPTAPAPSAPADSAKGVRAGTRLKWNPMNGAVYLVELGPATLAATYWIFTAFTTVTIPDLSELGLGLPKGTSYNWLVAGVAPFGSLDEAAGPTSFLPLGGSWTSGISAPRQFTTAP